MNGEIGVDGSHDHDPAVSYRTEIDDLLSRGNLAQAETLLRVSLGTRPEDPVAYNYLGLIALALDLPSQARQYFQEAIRMAPSWENPRQYVEIIDSYPHIGPDVHQAAGARAESEKNPRGFLLIKAWGYGFWSDVSHVLAQLLLAELTERSPVVHWGSNSLFGDGTESNAFEYYFDPISPDSIADIQEGDFDFWPPKWNRTNLMSGDVNKWEGSYSRVSGLYFLSRPEKVLVSDFYTGIIDLLPWIPASSPFFGLTIDEVSRYLVRKYIRPNAVVRENVNAVHAQYLFEKRFLSVHIRGSDKASELNGLKELNGQYQVAIERSLEIYGCDHILLLTDDANMLDVLHQRYGDLLVATDCLRSSDEKGIHYQGLGNGRRLGMEVMVDAYLAAKGRAFIGNGFSNVSLFMTYLGDWAEADVQLLGPNLLHCRNTILHQW